MLAAPRHFKGFPGGAAACVGLAVVTAVTVAATCAVAADPKTPGSPAAAPITQAMPDDYKLNMLIRTTLIALSQANQTGNYSVLRDLGTPQFQQLNSDARLVEIFASVRRRNLDLSPVVFFDPQLVRQPAIENGLLRLTGLIPTKPERILFDMGFEQIDGQWRLSAIVIDIQPSPEAAKEKPAGTPQANAKTDDKSNAKAKADAKAKAKEKPKPDNAPAAP
jgi:hypothetical protein